MFAIECHELQRHFVHRQRNSGLGAALKSFIRPQWVKKVAVSDISFNVNQGDCVGLVGANGAGKTTLLKMAAGLLHPSSGSVRVLGFVPSERKTDFQKSIGMVMGQKSQLWIDIPAYESFELLASIYKVSPADFKTRTSHLCELFGVNQLLKTPVRRLSLGERMKLEIIAALIHQPKLLFLDEPTIGLDLISKRTIRKFIRDFNREFKTTVILSSHDMTDISEVCQNLLLVEKGRLLFAGSLSSFEKFHKARSSEIAREVHFSFPLDCDINAETARAIAYKLGGSLSEMVSGSASFKVAQKNVSNLISEVLKISTPSDIRVESESLETLVHEVMLTETNRAQ